MDYSTLENSSLFQGIPAKDLRDDLEKIPHPVHCYDKGETIFHLMESAERIGIVERTYTLENAMNTEITELYVYKSKGENLTPNGLQPGEQVQAEVFGYYLHTPNETLYTVEYTTEGDKFQNTYSIRTLHIEDLFEVLYLTGADATSGATPVAFTAPVKKSSTSAKIARLDSSGRACFSQNGGYFDECEGKERLIQNHLIVYPRGFSDRRVSMS